jgi:fructose/tagatose bisphosphate aldolase
VVTVDGKDMRDGAKQEHFAQPATNVSAIKFFIAMFSGAEMAEQQTSRRGLAFGGWC